MPCRQVWQPRSPAIKGDVFKKKKGGGEGKGGREGGMKEERCTIS